MVQDEIPDADEVTSFGPFRLSKSERLVEAAGKRVHLGGRALDILIVLIDHAGEVVAKNDIIGKVWPDVTVDEGSLRFHVAALRKALGDGEAGARYVVNVPGRGYSFVAPVSRSKPIVHEARASSAPSRPHHLPPRLVRMVGRDDTVRAISQNLTVNHFTTIVGPGGIGKTTVAVAVAHELLTEFNGAIYFVDLGTLKDPSLVGSTIAYTLGVHVNSDNPVPGFINFLQDKRLLLVFDSCEHVIESISELSESLFLEASLVHILATSREPMRVEGEHVLRLFPLDYPPDDSKLTASEALDFPAVQVFMERVAAISDRPPLSDPEAPTVGDICRKLDGIPLALEFAAARAATLGISQVAALLHDRLSLLTSGRRTALPRHQTLRAVLDWSYELLPEPEQRVLRRLALFSGGFTLEAAIAVAGDDDTNAVEPIANLVAKSLVSADVGGAVVHYRLLETTRVYALEKLKNAGDFDTCARRQAQHYVDWFKSAETNWQTRTNAEWLVEYGQRIDDLRAALNWGFSPSGDLSIAVSLTVASSALWLAMAPAGECLQYIERALGSRTTVSTLTAREEARLLRSLGTTLMQTRGPQPYIRNFFTEALEIAERTDDVNGRARALLNLSVHCLQAGNYRESAALAERCRATGGESSDVGDRLMGAGVAAHAFYCLGEFGDAQRHIDSTLNEDSPSREYWFFGFRNAAQNARSNLQWLRGLPDQAMRSVESSTEQGEAIGVPMILMNTLAVAACSIALRVGDFAAAERWIATLLDLSTKGALPVLNAQGRCFRGMLLTARGDKAGLPLLESALDWLREAHFVHYRAIPTAALAQGLAEAGEMTRARGVIDEALEQANRSEEHWCMPELLRIKGEILLSDGSQNTTGEAEDYFHQALDRARQLEALSWELRAATKFARLWRREGKTATAKELLSSVYDRFTEGFETIDLIAAKQLLTDPDGAPCAEI